MSAVQLSRPTPPSTYLSPASEPPKLRYGPGDVSALATRLVATYTRTAAPGVFNEFSRFLWSNNYFREVRPLKDVVTALRDGSETSFLYHKASGLVFLGVRGATHALLAAYLMALGRTDFSQSNDAWGPEQFFAWNAESLLAEQFVETGAGLYQSSVGARDSVFVSETYKWSRLERRAFQNFRKEPVY